jgi:hypothetical protein
MKELKQAETHIQELGHGMCKKLATQVSPKVFKLITLDVINFTTIDKFYMSFEEMFRSLR